MYEIIYSRTRLTSYLNPLTAIAKAPSRMNILLQIRASPRVSDSATEKNHFNANRGKAVTLKSASNMLCGIQHLPTTYLTLSHPDGVDMTSSLPDY